MFRGTGSGEAGPYFGGKTVMQTLWSFALALCLVGTAALALGADYVPVSDPALGAIRLEPENAAEVTAPCDSLVAGSAEHTSELQPLMRRSIAVFCSNEQ